jgi:hypothetical protein
MLEEITAFTDLDDAQRHHERGARLVDLPNRESIP